MSAEVPHGSPEKILEGKKFQTLLGLQELHKEVKAEGDWRLMGGLSPVLNAETNIYFVYDRISSLVDDVLEMAGKRVGSLTLASALLVNSVKYGRTKTGQGLYLETVHLSGLNHVPIEKDEKVGDLLDKVWAKDPWLSRHTIVRIGILSRAEIVSKFGDFIARKV